MENCIATNPSLPYRYNVHLLYFSTRGQHTATSTPPTLHCGVVPSPCLTSLPKSTSVYPASQQEPTARLRRRLDQRTPGRQSAYLQAFCSFPYCLSPAEQLAYGGVSGRDNWGAAHTTWCPQQYHVERVNEGRFQTCCGSLWGQRTVIRLDDSWWVIRWGHIHQRGSSIVIKRAWQDISSAAHVEVSGLRHWIQSPCVNTELGFDNSF